MASDVKRKHAADQRSDVSGAPREEFAGLRAAHEILSCISTSK